MTDIVTEPAAASVVRKRRRRHPPKRTAAPAKVAAPKPADDLAGLTAMDCCAACGKGRCVITETAFCGHPYKGSQSSQTAEQFKKAERARKIIAHQKVGN